MNSLKKLINVSIQRQLLPMRAKKKLRIYEELYSKIRDFIRSMTKNSDDCDEKCMKIKHNQDDELPLNKMIEIPSMMIVVRAVFYENNKYYPLVY